MTDRDDVTMLQRMLLDQLAIDVGTVGAIEVFKKGIIKNVDDQRMMSADGRVIDAYIVVRQATNGVAFLGHVVFSQDLVVETKY